MRSKAFEKNIVTSCEMRTVCEVLREIYWHTDDLIIRDKVLEATTMAKKMDTKLREYKKTWDEEGMWEATENPEGIEISRREQYEREKSAV